MKKFLFVILFLLTSIFQNASANLIQNGGFEQNLTNWNIYTNPNVWTISEFEPYEELKSLRFEKYGIGYTDASIRSDTFDLQANVTYKIEVAIRDINTHDTYDDLETIFDLEVTRSFDEQWLWIGFNNTPLSENWQLLTGFFTPTEDVESFFKINIHGFTTDLPGWASIDSVSIEPVPIPATVWLLGTGIFGLAGFRRKDKKA